MNAREISPQHFTKTFNGYKPEEVEEYLRDIAKELGETQREKRDLEKKMEVLGDKIRDYRDDEEALKDALLLAQKQANTLIAEAKAKALKLETEARDRVKKQLEESEAANAKLIAEGKEVVEKAETEAARIVEEAKEHARKITADLGAKVEVQREILHRTKEEAVDFRNRIAELYKKHAGDFENIVTACESEFVAKSIAEYQKLKFADEKAAPSLTLRKSDAHPNVTSAGKPQHVPGKPVSFSVPVESVDKEKDTSDA